MNISSFKIVGTVFVVVWSLILSTPSDGYATLSLSVNPFAGGTSLRFGRVAESGSPLNNKEVRIRITSDEGTQYQVLQRVVDPLISERGVSLSVDALTSYTVLGSNSAGTLYQQEAMSFGYTDQLLYTSNGNGDSDAFTVIYSVNNSRLNAAGNFVGKIMYILRPIGAGAQQDSYLNVFLDIPDDFKVESKASSGMNTIRLNPEGIAKNEGYVTLTFSGNRGGEINIYQEILDFPKDQMSEEISRDIVQFVVLGSSGGNILYPNQTVLERRRVQIYSSSQGEGSVAVNFLVDKDKIEAQKAGEYKGQLKYFVEAGETQETIEVNLEVTVPSIFNLETQYPPGGVNFASLLPNSPPQIKEVEVTVNSNLGKPYMVMQTVQSPMANEKGQEIPREFFQVKAEVLDNGPGRIKFVDFDAVSVGEIPIYISDEKGSSSHFKVSYRLKPYPEIAAGQYTTAIVFSLGEL